MTEQMIESGWAQPIINGRKLRRAHWFQVRRNPGPPIAWIERSALCGRWWHYNDVSETFDVALQCRACQRLLRHEHAKEKVPS